MPEGLFVIRVVVGLLLAAHGAQKLFGWYGGHGLAGTGGFFEQLGHRPGRRMAMMAGMSEAGGGLLLALGLLTPLGAAMVMGTMLVASISVHAPQGLWASDGGYELPLTYGVVAMGLAFTGAGAWSVDHALGVPWTRGWGSGLLAIVLALAVSGVVLARRNTILAQADEPAYPEETAVVSSETEAGARQ